MIQVQDKFRSGTPSLNAELGTYGGKNSDQQCKLYGDEYM